MYAGLPVHRYLLLVYAALGGCGVSCIFYSCFIHVWLQAMPELGKCTLDPATDEALILPQPTEDATDGLQIRVLTQPSVISPRPPPFFLFFFVYIPLPRPRLFSLSSHLHLLSSPQRSSLERPYLGPFTLVHSSFLIPFTHTYSVIHIYLFNLFSPFIFPFGFFFIE